jgi:hypothetical protein
MICYSVSHDCTEERHLYRLHSSRFCSLPSNIHLHLETLVRLLLYRVLIAFASDISLVVCAIYRHRAVEIYKYLFLCCHHFLSHNLHLLASYVKTSK